MASNQVLVPNVWSKIALIGASIVLALIGVFEIHDEVVLNDGTVYVGKIISRDETSIAFKTVSERDQKIPIDRVASERHFRIDIDLSLGLDLKGGTTLRYLVSSPAGTTTTASPHETLDRAVDTFRNRLDTLGVKEISCVPAYESNQVVIELPGVTMDESESYQKVVESLGHLEFFIVVQKSTPDGVSYDAEKERLTKYLAANPGWTAKSVDLRPFDVKGRGDVVYRWFPYSQHAIEEHESDKEFPFAMMTVDPAQAITGRDLEEVYPTTDKTGMKAIGFRMKPERATAFGDFTGGHVGQLMAVVLDGEVNSKATLNSRIEREGIIEGGQHGFKDEQVKHYIATLRSGSLEVKPELQSKATIGPTLGEAAISRGLISGLIAAVLVLGFIILYYPGKPGVITAATLFLHIFLLIGGLGFLSATLTLPGIAGVILTLGMSVDQNILILERVREERAKGKTLFQSVKNGFERAFVTIFDSNATTFVTGAILYWKGTGPIKGFAVTLMLGIVTGMFASITGSKVLFSLGLDRGWFEKMRFRNPLGTMTVPYMNWGRGNVIASAIAIVLGLGVFAVSYSGMRGIDFAGGMQAHVRFKEPMKQAEVVSLVGAKFDNASVISMKTPEGAADRDFQVKVRAGEDEKSGLTFLNDLKVALGDRLLPEGLTGLTVVPSADGAKATVECALAFTNPIEASVIENRLKERMTVEAVTPEGGASPSAHYRVKGTSNTLRDPARIEAEIAAALTNLPGQVALSNPIQNSLFIGASVGKQLRNSAIISLFLAIIGMLIYIRVRFHDVKWGYAATIAVAQDALITLGLVAIFVRLGLIHMELDLTMVGSFLTLIGYSINDKIVIFDRIRENIPRVEKPFREVVDLSINQTMSRTLLTGGSVLISLLVLLIMNAGFDSVIEGFSFVMLAGVIVGTWSSVFIACPVLLWFTERANERAKLAGGQQNAHRTQPVSS